MFKEFELSLLLNLINNAASLAVVGAYNNNNNNNNNKLERFLKISNSNTHNFHMFAMSSIDLSQIRNKK